MLGNDIVDLTQASVTSNWQRKGYLEKLFNDDEIQIILLSKVPERVLWLLWSMKEGAYKIINRENGLRFYAPKKFECTISYLADDVASGQVVFEGTTLISTSEINSQFVHSTVLSSANDLDKFQLRYIPNNLNYLSFFETQFSKHRLMKTARGIPELVGTNGTRYVASVSHHGKYLALAYLSEEILG